MEEKNLILNLPFDESDGSTTAHDFSQRRTNATVHDCAFVSGKTGKAIEFDGNGYAEINGATIDFTGDLTVCAWLKVEDPKIGLCLQHGLNADDCTEREYAVQRGTWFFISIVKEGMTVRVYIDGAVVDTITLPAQLTGLGITQDSHATDSGVGLLDDVRVYNIAATAEDINGIFSTNTHLSYLINGKDFKKTWGIVVQASDGLVDRPEMKTPLSQDWPGYHGEVVDLDRKKLKPRDITLKCWMPCVSKLDFVNKWKDFCSQFEADGTQRFVADIHPTHPLVYEVYLRESLSVSKKWNDTLFVCTFTLKLREPDPVKRVIRFRVDSASEEHYIKIHTADIVTIAWGDGAFSHNVYGNHMATADALKHTYTGTGIYYAIVSGNIEEIEVVGGVEQFETDGIVVWNKF